MRKLTSPQTMREILSDNKRAETFLAAQMGKPLREDFPEIKEKRVRVKSEIPTESQEQRAFIKWFRMQYPAFKIFAIPNGGNRDAITGAIMQAEGVMKGVPDLYVPVLHLWIEMKRISGSATSEEQLAWKYYLTNECGDNHFFALGCDDAISKLREFLKGNQLCSQQPS